MTLIMSDAPAQAVNFSNQFLIAMPGLEGEPFVGSVVYLCEHTAEGALGIVLNKPTDLQVSDLFEKVQLPMGRPDLAQDSVYVGGPVATERGFVLHDGPAEGEAGFQSTLETPLGLYMTTSRDILENLSQGKGPRRVLVALGYAGWTAGQLEDEMANNAWIHAPASMELIFETPCEERYAKALSILGITAHDLSREAGHS